MRFGAYDFNLGDGAEMTAIAKPVASPLACPRCAGPVDVKSRHVAIDGTSVLVYCSAECLRARNTPLIIDTVPVMRPPKRRWPWWVGAGSVLVGAASFLLVSRSTDDDTHNAPTPFAIPAPIEAPVMKTIGSEDPRRAADEALVLDLMHDAWLHPLAGPVRRMPISHNAAFGAVRAGDRPPECLSGHCGVDLGSEWGEPVHVVHDGIVDTVNRGPNDEHGGIFVKVAHRGGTLYTWYFHLAAVPRWIRPGMAVKAGQMIGLLGDTGVFHSAPHLHFSISVKPSNSTFERYLDPEPLIAIWPLWIPKDANNGNISTPDPGMPVRAPEHKRARKKRPEPAAPAPAEAEPAPSGDESTTN